MPAPFQVSARPSSTLSAASSLLRVHPSAVVSAPRFAAPALQGTFGRRILGVLVFVVEAEQAEGTVTVHAELQDCLPFCNRCNGRISINASPPMIFAEWLSRLHQSQLVTSNSVSESNLILN